MKHVVNLSMKYFAPSILLIFFLIFILGLNNNAFGQAQTITSTNQTITIGVGQTLYYCINDPIDNLAGNNPATQAFTGNGITDPNPADGLATFNPLTAGAGIHTIYYHSKSFTFFVSNPVSPTLGAFGIYCSNSPPFTLNGGLPVDPTGKYYVEGVVATTFDPTARGAGTYSVMYSVGTGACLAYSGIKTIIVRAIPVITYNQPTTPLCSDAAPIDLTLFISPSGGVFSGGGVVGNTFDPSKVAAPGTYTIRYTYNDGICTNYAERNITVNPVPVITITGLNINHCDYDPNNAFTYSPVTGAGGTGVLTGDGITDLGGGNAIFSPITAGLGYHNMSYTYTDINGCTSSQNILIRVGTDIKITGLVINYCSNEAPVNFNYSHWDTDPLNPPDLPHTLTITGGSGLIDNGNGSATFNPSVGVGTYTITYTYTDDLTCINRIDQFVQVLPAPVANFSGLNAAFQYCEGAADVTLSGNPPNGTFNGPAGSIVNTGGGIATFKPSALLTGGPYPITYSFTNSSGCTDTDTKNVIINALPVAYAVSGTGSYCQGSGGLTVTLLDSDPGVNYQLYKNGIADGASVPGTGNAITWPGKTTGTYTIEANIAATGCTKTMSGAAGIIELAQAIITTMPVDDRVCEKGSAVFSITSSGQNLNYAWTKNGAAIGGNSNILVLNDVTMADDGHLVVCTVTSTCPVGFSSSTVPVTLEVDPNTAISTHPSNVIKCAGTSHTFSVTATGINNKYQWKKGAADVPADIIGKISGSKTSSLTIFDLVAGDAGLYSCVVSGGCGVPVQSTQATLTVDDPIVITSQPTPVPACDGTSTSFSVTATGSISASEWFFDKDDTGPVLPVSVGTGMSLALSGITVAANEGYYYCKLTSPCLATATTNSVKLTVPVTTAITTPPAGGTICELSNFIFSVTASGESLLYEWYQDGTKLTDNAVVRNSSTANLTLTGATTVYTGNYSVKVTGTCGSETSIPAANLTVKKSIIITSQPANQTVCSGSGVTFSVTATGDVLAYRWQYNTVDVPGANTPNYTIASANLANAGNYRCKITTLICGTFYSSEATLTINPTTTIVSPLAAVTNNACAGTNVSYSVVATGIGLTYQWYKNGVSLAPGFTNATISLSNISASDAASYTCTISGTCGPAVTTQPWILSVEIPAVISNHPKSQSVCLNTPYNITVSLSAGTNPVYQWYFNGTPVGGNTPVYPIPSFTGADAGDYYCKITNGCGTVTSQTASLTLVNTFTITQQPADINVCENGTATFTVNASQPGVTYQWQKNNVNIPGANTSTLILNNVPLSDNGSVFNCVVSNSCGTLTSNGAILTVTIPLNITQQPQSGYACPGSPYSIIIVASGSIPTFQWYKAPATLLVGKTSSALSFSPFVAGDAGTYYCVVSNGCGTVTSNNAVINSGVDISITNPAPLLSLCEGVDATFTITATGTNPQYEWRKNNIPLTDDGRIIGSGTNSLTIKNIIAADEGTYNVIVTGTCGLYKTSTGAFLDVTTPPSISIGPVPQTICSGNNASFSVTVPVEAGDPLPTYSWQKDGATIIPAETASTLNITGVISGGIYRCVVTNSCGSITSTSAELVIEENLNISSQPTSLTRCEGSDATFTIGVTGPTNMVLQWYKNGLKLTEDARVIGVNLPSLTINNITSSDEGSYWCEITSLCGNTTTNSATLTVHDRIIITQQPQSITICPTGTLNLSVINTGTVTTYQWKRNGVNVGVNSPTYSVSPFNAATHAGNYTCEMTNICETVITDIAVVTGGVPTVATISGDLTRCEGSGANFTITATGSDLVYQWYKNSTPLTDDARIGGSQSNNLTINSITASDGGTYQCDVSGTCGFDNDNSAVLTVQNNVTIDVEPASISVLLGNTAIFMAVASGNITGYQWYKGTTLLNDLAGEISGATTSTLNIINAQFADAGDYMCVISGSCGNVNSKSATLNVLTSTVITTQPASPVILCEGSSLSLSIATSGTGHTYQWKQDNNNLSNGGNISGANTSSLTINNTTTDKTGAYTCVVDGIETSSASIVTVRPTTIISVNPAGATKCVGDIHIFSVSAAGSGLSYQWYKNNLASPIVTATSDNYIINPVATTDNGTYFCVVTGSCGVKTSSSATLTVNINLVVNAQPDGVPICQGASTTLFFDVTGSGLTYLWKKNGQPITDTDISGMTTNTLQISSAVPSYSGNYTCTVSGNCSGPITSSVTTVTINPTTVIKTQPIGRTKCEGDAVTFTVEASGNGLVYTWFKDGVSLGLPSNPVLTIPVLVKATHEGTYTCRVEGSCGAIIISVPAVLTVNRNTTIGVPSITTNPICQGASTTITIAATGDGLTYLWKKEGQPITGTNISGITSSELVISNVLITDAGVYTCTVTGACGSPLTSSNASLTINPTTVINTQPSNFTRCSGDEVTFTVQANGDNLNYQWKKGGATGTIVTDGLQVSGATVTGAATTQMKITGITSTESGSYVCVITGTCGNVNSTPAQLDVTVPVQITTEPLSLTSICQGSSTQISVTTIGTVTGYKWKKNGVYLTDGGSISGVSTNKLIISNALLTDAGFYSCEIAGVCNTVSTQSAELRVNPTTIITQQPVGKTLCEGDNVQFMINATGAGPLTYQWKLNNAPIGANSSSLTINNITSLNAGAYTCVVTGASTCGTATSDPANLTVNPKINITVQPINTTVCEGSTAIISLTATGTSPVSYKWKYNDSYIDDGGRVTGTKTNELRIAFSTNTDEGIYKCEILSDCGTYESNSAVLDVTNSTKITIHPVSQTLLQGSTATFNVAATGTGLTYQWQKDNSNIGGSTSDAYSIANVQPSDMGSYRCVVTGNCGQVISNIAILTVNQLVSITTPPAPVVICAGQTASFSVIATGTIISYQWKFNGSDISDGSGISGSKTANLIISPAAASHDGYYSCVITGSNNIANSIEVKLTINIPVAITQQPITQTKCDGDILVLEVTPNEPSSTYIWEFNGNPLSDGGRISGAGSSKLVIVDVSSADAGSYRCTISNICNSVKSDPAVVTINPVINIVTQPVNDTKCEGQTTSFLVSATGTGLQYQWYKNGTPLAAISGITGINTSNLTISNLTSVDQGSYSCLISDNCTSINSTTAVLTVKEVVVVNTQPSNITVCEGENSFFEVKATGYNLAYKWQKDGVALNDAGNITGSNTSVLIINNTTLANQGVYRCIITGDCNSILTNTSNLSVNLLPGAAGTISGVNVICQGSKNVLYVVPAISNATSYVWTLPYGATIVSGAGTRSIQVNFATNSLSGVISVHGLNGCASGTESPLLPVTINPIPLAAAGADQTLCLNTTTFNANATAFGTWTRISGLATIANPNLPNSSVTGIGQGDNVFLWTVSENGCVARDTVVVSNNIVNVDAGTDQTICSLTSKLNANTPAIGLGSWSIVTGGAIFSSSYDPKADVINLSRGTNILRWSINNKGCVTYDDVSIKNDLPGNAKAGVDTILLVNSYVLSGNAPTIGTGLWSLGSGSGSITDPSSPTSSVTNLGIGENLLIWTITNNNCSSRDEVKVINYTPTLTSAGPDQTLCSNRTSLSGTIPNYGTGQWTVVLGSGTFVNPSKYDTEVTRIGQGINVFRWTIYEYKVTFDDVTITNNSPTSANAGIDQRICINQTKLSANQPIIGTPLWTIVGGSAVISNINQYNTTVTNLGYGLNTFRWTITNGACISSDEVIIINDQPSKPDAGVDQITCANSVMLYPNTPSIGAGEWSVISGSANFAGNQANSLGIEDNYFKWTISNNGCSLSDTVKITSHKPSNAYAGSDRSVCGESILLNANNPGIGTGNWVVLSGAATIADPNKYNSEVTNFNLGKNILRWIITYKDCTTSDDVIITNDKPTNFDAGTDQYLCASATQLYASVPSGGFGRWSIAAGSSAFSDNTLFNTNVSNLGKGANKLVWTLTIGGCSNSDTVIITNNLPSLPSAGPDQDNCASESFMAANLPQIGTGKWSVVSGSATFENPANPYTKVTNAGNGSNLLRWTITNGSCNIYDEMYLINSLPTLAYAGEDRAVCNNTANLLANPPTSGTGTWRVVSGFGVISNTNDYNTQITTLGFGPNTIRWTTENGRCRTSDDVIITNNLAEVNAGLDKIVYSSTVSLVGNKPAKGIGEWRLVAGKGIIETPSNFETSVANIGEGANSFYWIINNDGCIAFDDVIITYYVLPKVDFTPSPQSGCAPLFVDFINGSVGGNPFTWDFGDGTASNQTNPMHTYNLPGKFNVRLTATGPDGITVHKDTVVIIKAVPVAQFEVTPDTAFIPGNSVHFFNLSNDIDSLLWEFGDGTTSTEKNPSYKYTAAGSYDVTLHVWSGYQCYDSLNVRGAVVVEPAGIIKCPNAFSPNTNGPSGGYYNKNDFSNDVFHCYIEGAAAYHLEIYNRLGIRLFESDDINIGWDGYFKGKLVEEGAYVFKVNGRFNNGEPFDYFGNIVVLR